MSTTAWTPLYLQRGMRRGVRCGVAGHVTTTACVPELARDEAAVERVGFLRAVGLDAADEVLGGLEERRRQRAERRAERAADGVAALDR